MNTTKHDPCCTCEPCDDARFRPSTAAAVIEARGHVFDRPHAAGEHGAALTSFNRSGAKR